MAIFELRTYTLKTGMLQPYLKFYHAAAMDIHVRHLGPSLGWWYTDIGPLNELVMLWRYDSFEEREARRARLMADPDWLAFLPRTGDYIASQDNRIMKAAFFSPMQ